MVKLIKLTNGMDAKVDDRHYDALAKFRWGYSKIKSTSGSGETKIKAMMIGGESAIDMRQYILRDILKYINARITDFDGDGINNLESNLKVGGIPVVSIREMIKRLGGDLNGQTLIPLNNLDSKTIKRYETLVRTHSAIEFEEQLEYWGNRGYKYEVMDVEPDLDKKKVLYTAKLFKEE